MDFDYLLCEWLLRIFVKQFHRIVSKNFISRSYTYTVTVFSTTDALICLWNSQISIKQCVLVLAYNLCMYTESRFRQIAVSAFDDKVQ